MPEARTRYLRSLLEKPKAIKPDKPVSTGELLKKRRADRTKREAEIQRNRRFKGGE